MARKKQSQQDLAWDGSINTDWYLGHEEDETYTISNAAEIAGLAQLVNDGTSDFLGKTIILGADIDLNNLQWIPIGNSNDVWFNGNFEGEGHFIGNLKIEGDVEYAGLFGYIINNGEEATFIKNVNLRGVDISIDNADSYVGGLVGFQDGRGKGSHIVENCSVKGKVSSSGSYVGDIVGLQGSIVCQKSNEDNETNQEEV